jgi:hypothetical protein
MPSSTLSTSASTLREQFEAGSTSRSSSTFLTAGEHPHKSSVADLIRNTPTHPSSHTADAFTHSDMHSAATYDSYDLHHTNTNTASSSVPPSRRPSLSVLQEADFAQPSHKSSDIPDLRQATNQEETQSIHSNYQDDGSSRASPFNSPSTSPSRSRYHSRTASRDSASRLRQAASLDLNGDLWLGAQGIAEWEREHRERVRRINETNRGRCEAY